ncbi:unnamed protein product [Rotaria sordida]|uniref:LITAF domain-containing protein n=1 Tax=Rotaria sordida TaxID=392033 RepID=A0A815NB46_9BILA|nr:unnamed protein product [Rotaria sordida]
MSSAPPPPYSVQDPYQQQLPKMSQPVYISTPVIIRGEYPTQCTCPQCGNQIVTRTQKKAGALTWIICLVLFFVFLWFLCWIPFCIDSCQDTQHYCPSCGALLGIHKPL